MNTGACREDWNAMHTVEGGRFCGKCQHAVMDFTGWDRSAVIAYKREHPDACGVYRAEHIEPDLVPLMDLLRPKRGLLAAGLTLGSITVTAQEPASPPPSEYTRPAAPVNDPRAGQLIDTPSSVAEADKHEALFGTCTREAPLAAPRVKPYRYRRMYVSKRFPFIHFRRPRRMGRMVLRTDDNMLRITGTPSF